MTQKKALFDIRSWAPYQLWLISQEAGHVLEAYYTPKFNIKGDGWRFLAMLASCAPISAKDIGTLLDQDQVRIARTLSKLLDLGYATRRTDPLDRRKVILSLSQKGQAVYEDISQEAARLEQHLLAGLEMPEQQLFKTTLKTLSSNLSSLKDRSTAG